MQGFGAAAVHVKADWAEFAKTLGFTSWASTLYPCPCCKRTKQTLYDLAGFGPLGSSWPLLDHSDMDRAAPACEVRVSLHKARHREVLAALQYQKQKQGPRGRALVKDLPLLSLRKGYRLEPTADMLDVALFDEPRRFPLRATFWRRRAETRVAFRNPLWDPAIGLTMESLAVDILHTVYLGPALFFVGFVFWEILDGDFWRLGQGLSLDGRWRANVQNLRSLLREYYAAQRRKNPQKPLTELEDLTINMMGNKKGALPKFRAVETNHLLPFVIDLVRRLPFEDPLRSNQLGAGTSLWRFVRAIDDSPGNVEPQVLQLMYESYKRFMRFCELVGVPRKPKNHLFGHLVQRAE